MAVPIDTLRDALFGNPPSTATKPSREGVLAAFVELKRGTDTALSDATVALTAGDAALFPTKSAMDASLAYPNQKPAIVFNDPVPANNALYLKNGDSGAGFWGVTSILLSGAFGAEVDALTDQVDLTQGAITGFEEIQPMSQVDGAYVSISDNVIKPNAGLSYAVYQMQPSQRFRLVTVWRGGDVAAVNWFNGTTDVANRKGNALPGQNIDVYFALGDQILNQPIDADLLVVNHNRGTPVHVMVEQLVTSAAKQSTPVPAITTGLLSGRGSMLVIGTSIDAARSTQAVVSALGVTVANQALGGGMYRAGFYANQQATGDDVDGLRNVNWEGAVRSFTMDDPATPFNKRYGMLNGWGYWQEQLGNKPVPPLNDGIRDLINGSGYYTRLDPYIDAAHPNFQPGFDTFYLGAPFNDWNNVPTAPGLTEAQAWAAKNADMVVVNPADDYDRTTVYGALNWIIRRIYEKCVARGVHPKIGLMGHYECQRASGIRAVQEMVQKRWSVPLYPLYDLIGVSSVAITVNGGSTTVFAQELPDTVHPHSDPLGRIQLAKARHDVIFARDWLV